MRSEKGQALVETALILPILLLLLFGITDFGRAFHAYLTLDHAGREIARLVSVHSSNSNIQDRLNSSFVGLDTTKLTISIDICDELNNCSPIYPFVEGVESTIPTGADVEVTFAYNFDFITPLVSTLASPITLTDITVMRVE